MQLLGNCFNLITKFKENDDVDIDEIKFLNGWITFSILLRDIKPKKYLILQKLICYVHI